MSERHSGQAGTGAGNEVDSPIVNVKDSSSGDLCSICSFQDSGYSELLKSCSFDNTDKEFFGKKEKGSTLIHEHPETSSLALTPNLESPTQKKTSTVDDSKDNGSLFEVECISPIQGSGFKDSFTHDFSDSSLCVNDENTHPKLLGSSVSGTTYGTDEDIFVTPISNLVANIKFTASQRLTPSTEVRRNISTPEDSGFNSLCLDKSGDSLSDQEGSFQELLQKHNGALKVGDTVRKSRHLERLRRLSTLREQSSQSETEEEQLVNHSGPETTPAVASDSSESQPSSDNKSEDLILSFPNLSKTPALQLMHELFMKSKRKRFQQNGAHELLEERDGERIAVLQRVLAGLIGKKMGIEKLDILTELKCRNLKHILAVVLDSLTVESLCRKEGGHVEQDFCKVLGQGIQGNLLEGAVLNVEDAATRLHVLNRSALRSVQAQARTPGFQREQISTFSPWGEVLTPVASSAVTPLSSKQEEYVKVAKTLFIDEALKPCPRCQSPAKYQPYKKRGLCSRTACGFDFCVLCLCAYHGSEECSRGAARPRNRKDALPGSAQTLPSWLPHHGLWSQRSRRSSRNMETLRLGFLPARANQRSALSRGRGRGLCCSCSLVIRESRAVGLASEPPAITEEEFENSLATDDFLVDYLNEFLSLPTFSEAIRFNADFGVFEVVNNAPQLLEKQLKKILLDQQPRNPIYDVVRKEKNNVKPVQVNAPHYEDKTVNVNYNIMGTKILHYSFILNKTC
ncbi:F-box only protein 43 [Camelus ferus]|nr:F-box only protein 43 [Camelus ferus]